jgi:hypothetical protein
LVRDDVQNMIVSRESARQIYGVVLNDRLEVDVETTRELRVQIRKQERETVNEPSVS